VCLLLVNAEVGGRRGVDVRIAGSSITEVGRGLARRRDDEVLDANGGALIPGFHDHHLHLLAVAAARSSVALGPPDVTDRATFARRLRQAADGVPGGAWLRAVGYHESVAGMLDRHMLDAVVRDVPIRVQHRSGILWVLNSLALERTGLAASGLTGVERDADGSPTGRLWHLDETLRAVVPSRPELVGAVREISAELAAQGVTGFTDATPMRRADLAFLAATLESAQLLQGVYAMSRPDVTPSEASGLPLGPVKVRLDDAALPGLHELSALITSVHDEGRAVAIHCVGRTQLILSLSALELAEPLPSGSGLRDRLEHASVVPPSLVPKVLGIGVVVVSQPQLVCERGDHYLAEVDPDDRPALYPLKSLASAGIPVAFGSDAPYGSGDPWAAIRGAMTRRTASGRTVGASERLNFGQALRGFIGRPERPDLARGIEERARADLVLLGGPLEEVARCPDASAVAATVIGGQVVHGRGG
jgi:predicted amidohydrolase YtcJ